MAKKASKASSNDGERKLFAFLATFLTIIGFIIALLVKRDDDYIMHYGKEGLVLFIIVVIANVASWIPFVGWLSWIIWVLFVILWVMSWLNALSGEKKKTFLIGEFAEKIRL